jgi:hypothetical protein
MSTIPQSTTPRTDAAKVQYMTGKTGVFEVLNEARTLETELAAEREKVRVLRDAMTRLQGYCEWVIPPHDRICAIARAALADGGVK